MLSDNNDEKDKSIEDSSSAMRRTKRLLSQIPLPSNGLMLRQLPTGNATIVPVRKRRTVSEQVNRRDR